MTYVQRQIDDILRKYRNFARAYVDDIVIFNKSLEEHLRHLNDMFSLFDKLNIALKSFKTFLEYLIIELLSQKVNSLKLTTIANKLVAISDLKFLKTLKHLKKYLKKNDWLRNYVSYYAQKTYALQQRKTRLLKQSLIKSRARKAFSQSTAVKLYTDAELNSFNQLQRFFSRLSYIVYFDKIEKLYIDVHAFKKRDFKVMIYHVKKRSQSSNTKSESSKRTNVKSIMFLSKILSFAKQRYWSTELEMTEFVWVMRNLRLMIISFDHFTMIYTDHAINSFIVRQTILSLSSVD